MGKDTRAGRNSSHHIQLALFPRYIACMDCRGHHLFQGTLQVPLPYSLFSRGIGNHSVHTEFSGLLKSDDMEHARNLSLQHKGAVRERAALFVSVTAGNDTERKGNGRKTQTLANRELQGKVGKRFLSDGKVRPQAVSEKIILAALRYFSQKYRFSILRPDCEDTISVGFLPDYKLYVDHIISRLNGQTFREKAEEEIIIRSLFASKRRERGTAPELRDNKILFYDIVEMDDYQRSIGRYQIAYGTDTFVNNICAGLVLYATQSIQGNIGSIPEFNQYNVQVGKWYDMKMDKIEAIRFYVNGRIDVRFSTPTAAAECFHFLRLYSLANH